MLYYQPPLPKGRGTAPAVEGYKSYIINHFPLAVEGYGICTKSDGPSGTDNAQFLSEHNYIALQNFKEILLKVCHNSFLQSVPTIYQKIYLAYIQSFSACGKFP